MLTFIIPSINRPTLKRTLDSLLSQTDPDWKAIVVFDGVETTLPEVIGTDSRISCINIPKTGKLNHGGAVRNVGIVQVSQSDNSWIGFVDDDDTLSPDYITRFKEELSLKPNLDVIIFRLIFRNNVIPSNSVGDIIKSHVGISFCMRKDIPLRFDPSSAEDFDLLSRLKQNGFKMMISSYITYFARTEPINNINLKLNKVYIN